MGMELAHYVADDPGETRNLAADPAHRKALLAHRVLLQEFGAQHKDNVATEMLADDVKPRPFKAGKPQAKKSKPKKPKRK